MTRTKVACIARKRLVRARGERDSQGACYFVFEGFAPSSLQNRGVAHQGMGQPAALGDAHARGATLVVPAVTLQRANA